MQVEEFMALVGSEPERTISQTVWTAPPDALAKAAKLGGILMTEFLSASGRRAGQRDVHYCHILGPPGSPEAIDAWLKRRAPHRLPTDLHALVKRINGIHLWANVETGRSYVGLAPIEEWELARIRMCGEEDGGFLDDRYVAISYHQDGASFVVLDAESGAYFLMDAAGPDRTSRIANNTEELLDWLWRTRIVPKAS